MELIPMAPQRGPYFMSMTRWRVNIFPNESGSGHGLVAINRECIHNSCKPGSEFKP